jgi:UDPglucose--hexose-1-phosphate uridylyltransferase
MATKEWVLIATERAKRPDDYVGLNPHVLVEDEPDYEPTCPFCPGNEELDLEVERMPAAGPWQTRVVRNKFPALNLEGEVVRRFDGLNRRISGVGYHEVVVDHPRHNTTLALMTPAEINIVLQTFYNRGWEMVRDARVEHIIYFKNHGERAGASLKHPHSQIIALPVVPNDVRHRIEEARRYFDDNGECAYCVMLQKELQEQQRLISVSKHFVAFILYAASSPFHIWILPRQHSVNFIYAQKEELADLAGVLNDVARRFYFGLRDPAYNLIVRAGPVKELGNEYLHWYITLVPRLNRAAGFELASGMYINPALPEASAEFLRNVNIQEP